MSKLSANIEKLSANMEKLSANMAKLNANMAKLSPSMASVWICKFQHSGNSAGLVYVEWTSIVFRLFSSDPDPAK